MYTCINNCGYSHSHRGAMNIHERIHCPKIRITESIQTKTICNHDYRILRDTDVIESKAIKLGFKILCEKCEDLR